MEPVCLSVCTEEYLLPKAISDAEPFCGSSNSQLLDGKLVAQEPCSTLAGAAIVPIGVGVYSVQRSVLHVCAAAITSIR